MEQTSQPRGDQNEIATHDEPVVHHGRAESTPPPLTFAEAEQHNPFRLLVELYDHAMIVDRQAAPADHHLAELALSAAVVAWWSRWLPLTMHRAFAGGASLTEVAAAAGTLQSEAYQCWSAWAEAQSRALILGRPGVDPGEVATIRAQLAAELPDPPA